ncbi:MAG: tetratricopeptide repeat protein, partial [Thermodesulfobacteriota bacterium]
TQTLFSVSCSGDKNARIWGLFFWRTSAETRAFADAMNRLRSAARGEGDSGQDGIWRDFARKAADWRALPSKPPVSEEVRQHRLVAENALREKDFDTAVAEYIDGLESDPLWPEGHFNAALLMGELGYYTEAIRHIQAYVELVPEAPDAQAARDQIVIWKVKAQKMRP